MKSLLVYFFTIGNITMYYFYTFRGHIFHLHWNVINLCDSKD